MRFVLALAASLALPAGTEAAPTVVASVKPVHSLAAGVMEGVGEPALLVPGGQSPHTYTMRPSDAARLEEAGLVIWVGPGLEPFLERPVGSLVAEGAALRLDRVEGLPHLPVREGGVWEAHDHAGHAHGDDHEGDHDEQHTHGNDHDHDHAEDHGHGRDEAEIDPHLHLDPGNAQLMVGAIAERLAAIDPANAAAYRANAEAMQARIEEAETAATAALEPVRDRRFVVFHDAYQYFERHFGMTAAGAITLSPERRPSAQRLAEIREAIETRDAACVFAEPQFEPALAQTAVEGTGARLGTLDPLGVELAAGPGAYPALILGIARDMAACLGAVE